MEMAYLIALWVVCFGFAWLNAREAGRISRDSKLIEKPTFLDIVRNKAILQSAIIAGVSIVGFSVCYIALVCLGANISGYEYMQLQRDAGEILLKAPILGLFELVKIQGLPAFAFPVWALTLFNTLVLLAGTLTTALAMSWRNKKRKEGDVVK